MTDTRARLVPMTSFDGSRAICADLNDNGPYQPLVFLDKDGIRRAENVPASLGFPLDAQGRIALVGEGESPRGEWRRGWINPGSNMSHLFKWKPHDYAVEIEYRVVGEGGEDKKDDRLWGVQYRDGGVISFDNEHVAREAFATACEPKRLVRLTVEPVGEVG